MEAVLTSAHMPIEHDSKRTMMITNPFRHQRPHKQKDPRFCLRGRALQCHPGPVYRVPVSAPWYQPGCLIAQVQAPGSLSCFCYHQKRQVLIFSAHLLHCSWFLRLAPGASHSYSTSCKNTQPGRFCWVATFNVKRIRASDSILMLEAASTFRQSGLS